MTKILKGFYPNFKIHKVCANDDLRPAMGYVFFKDGYAYATEAHIAIAAPLSTISNFTNEEKKLLEGKLIHATQFAKLLTMQNVEIELVGEKLCFYCTTPAGETVIMPLLTEEQLGKFPNIESVLVEAEKNAKELGTQLPHVGFKPSLLDDIVAAMNAKIIEFYFAKPAGAIIVRDQDKTNEIRAIMMPCMIGDPKF